ncbi:MAG: adenylyltransferase/cytidyltransferase family protein [Ruminococcus sp.]|nr:adenylyltransferase/cytidyltransferase family protein [Ruminococcus sp.]
MGNKPFRLGIVIGRFQTFHLGHEEIINKAVALCDEVGVFIGSSQEHGTAKNPFTYEKRESILRKVFDDKVKIFPLPDIGVGNNSKWGEYVLENVVERFSKTPDLLVSGKEQRRIDWFDSVSSLVVAELYIPKTIDISATKMREHLVCDDFCEWKKYTNEKLWGEYETFKSTILSCKDNLETDSI